MGAEYGKIEINKDFMFFSKLKLHRLYAFPAVFLLVFTIAVFRYVHKHFADANLGQILFFLNTSSEGADENLRRWFIEHCILTPCLYTLAVCYLPELLKLLRIRFSFAKFSYNCFISLLSLFLTVGYIFYKTDEATIERFLSNESTDFYEKHFAEPRKEDIQFPVKKNLIVLHVESFEKTFENREFFGENLLADLADLEVQNVQFKNFSNGFATDFTQGSIIALFTGMPARYSSLVQRVGRYLHFFKGYYTLGKILKDNGYTLAAVQGTNSKFGGMEVFFMDNEVEDQIDSKKIKKEYPQYAQNSPWGYTDDVVLDIAKAKVAELANKSPYFLHVQTIDTHVGHKKKVQKSASTDNVYHEMIRQTCKNVADFLEWMRQRPDYKDTVIVVIGDHLRLGNDFPMPEERRIYNLFINTAQPANVDRTFTQVDLFPTIIEAMGGKIKDHRLGLGTSVFSKEQTLSEKYSKDFLQETLAKRNKFYEEMFLK